MMCKIRARKVEQDTGMISISNSSMPNMSLGGVFNTAAAVLKTIYQEKEQEYVVEEKRGNGVNANSTTTSTVAQALYQQDQQY